MSVKINRDYICLNPNNTGARKGKGQKSDYRWIVVHYVGACNWKTGFESTAKDNCIYYRNSNVGASANFYVDSTDEVYQSVPWDSDRYAWHCGTGSSGKYQYCLYDADGVYCSNPTSLGVEICTCKQTVISRGSADPDWYFDPRTYAHAVEFVKYLMKEFNIDIDHVVRHYDVNTIHKLCPSQFVSNTVKTYYNKTGEQLWQQFKADLMDGVTPEPTPTPDPTPSTPANPATITSFPPVPFMVKVIIPDLNYRTEPSMNGIVKGQTGIGTFTITEVQNGWGRLKSGAGWIYIANPSYCTISGSTVANTTSTTTNTTDTSYLVEILTALNVRAGAGKSYKINKVVHKGEVYTIVEEKDGWGKLKSGAGWISLAYTRKL